ncbi:MAG TPA: hypothetical protein VI039_06475 [Solirubrobacterales bacterium]
MTIKKIVLLTSMALALVAFAAPAAQAENTTWYTDDTEIGDISEPQTVEVHGELSSTLGFKTGPAVVHGHGDIWNDPETNMGEGEITEFEITGELSVGPGLPETCKATGTADNLGWPITATTNVVDIEAAFENHYNAVCQALGFPKSVTASGIATGVAEGNCLNFVNAGDLETAAGGKVLLNGQVCITDVDANGDTTDGVITLGPHTP